MARLFNTPISGCFRYFVRPQDDFVLNSLEILDCDEYTYRLLRSEGYDRVIFIDYNKVYTYDNLSHYSFLLHDCFNGVNDINERKQLEAAYEKVKERLPKNNRAVRGANFNTRMGNADAGADEQKAKLEPEFGKRTVAGWSTGTQLESYFAQNISAMFKDKWANTAIVMPLLLPYKKILDNPGRNTSSGSNDEAIELRISEAIKEATKGDKKGDNKNIVVFTLSDKAEFVELYRNNPYASFLHTFVNNVTDAVTKNPLGSSYVTGSVDYLKRQGRIVLTEGIGEDEIANLILRKKLIEGDKRFKGIPSSKVYFLAQKIRNHLLGYMSEFETLPGSNNNMFIHQPLEIILNDDSLIEELTKKCAEITPTVINRVDENNGVYVERVSHIRSTRLYEYVGEAEREIKQLEETLVGEEMRKAKDQVVSTIEYFVQRKERYEKKIKSKQHVSDKDYPWMNILLYGAPGTGKSTIADIVARIMNAKGILPQYNVQPLQAVDLVSGNVGGVQEKLLASVDKAVGGVLVIDELQGILEEYRGGNLARDFMRTLVAAINKHKKDLCVILCGYEDEVNRIIAFDNGAPRRFSMKIKLESYSVETLMQILRREIGDNGNKLEDGLEEKIEQLIKARQGIDGAKFANAAFIIDELLMKLDIAKNKRQCNDDTYTLEDLINAFPDMESYIKHGADSSENIIKEFDEAFIGEEMKDVKKQVIRAVNYFASRRKAFEEKTKAKKKIKDSDYPWMNMLFYGAPGTGKTTISEFVASLMNAKGILPKNSVYSVQASNLGSKYVNGVQENLKEEAEKAVGGVLVIDELQALNEPGLSYNMAKDFMLALVGVMNAHKDNLCVILCGYEDEVNDIIKYDKGAKRRFSQKIGLENYSVETLMQIFEEKLKDECKKLGDGMHDAIMQIIRAKQGIDGKEFGNAGFVKDELFSGLEMARIDRNPEDDTYTLEDLISAFPDMESYIKHGADSSEEIIREFEETFIGEEMQNVKSQVIDAVNYFKYVKAEAENKRKNKRKISSSDETWMNMLFYGAPGTGKSTIAKYVAALMHVNGVLPRNHVHTIMAGSLGSKWVNGVYENLTKEVEKAIGGVLVIDELQAIKGSYNGGDLAEDFMRALVGVMNEHKDNLCVILCGYEDEVNRIIKYDDGADRRFSQKIRLESYSVETLMQIFDKLLDDEGKKLADNARARVREIIEDKRRTSGKSFGNAGFINDELFVKINMKYIARKGNDNVFTLEDVEKAYPKAKHEQPRMTKLSMREFAKNSTNPCTFDGTLEDEEKRREITDLAVLFIKTDNGSGTGFLISSDGYAITCDHVIRNKEKDDIEENITARFRDPSRRGSIDSVHKCKVVYTLKDVDMAVIKLEGDNFPYLKLASKDRKIKSGETFTLSGYPFGINEDITDYVGTVANGRGVKDSAKVLCYNINTEGKCGQSGSPLIAHFDGSVIGILTGSIIVRKEEINRMRPISFFWDEFFK